MRHGGSPKGARNSGGLDVEAAEVTEEVQKGEVGSENWTLKQRKTWRKSKTGKPEARIGR